MHKNFRSIIGLFLLLLTGTVSGVTLTNTPDRGAVLGDKNTTVLVTDVIDGDTIAVSLGSEKYTVRLLGIDTPELKHPRKEIECFAKEASAKAEDLLLNKAIVLEADATQEDKDRYGRLLRYVYLLDGTLVNEVLVKEGYAHEYTYKAPYNFQSEFKDAQKYAQQNSLGLWGGSCITPSN